MRRIRINRRHEATETNGSYRGALAAVRLAAKRPAGCPSFLLALTNNHSKVRHVALNRHLGRGAGSGGIAKAEGA